MKSFLLLVLSLTTGCEAKDKVKGCTGAWVEFTCNYPKSNSQSVGIVHNTQITIRSTRKNEWEHNNRFSLYHDTQNRNLRVFIKHLVQDDSGDYQCRPHQSRPHTNNLQLDPEKSCLTTVIQTAYTTAETTITCHYNLGNTYKSSVRFFCKMNISTSEEILSADSPPQTNGRFTLTNTDSGFTVSISNVSSEDEGIYWCGVKPDKGRYRTGLTEIQLEVQKIKYFKKIPNCWTEPHVLVWLPQWYL
uniref:polymeric immunoglobulin receptor-like n=1 Tax=Monopterus albus TaxID=43700 RepID=UPI0009B4C623|nr:polymeric immunoglobulin receptor-like [Monopterus albus]